MANKIFNTPFETMLRILILLNEANSPMDKDKIAALDFISIYGKSCGMLESNINGENRFNFAEFARKRELVTEAISDAVRRDFLIVSADSHGFSYALNDRGARVLQGIDSSYARGYAQAASVVVNELGDRMDVDLLRLINQKANEAKDNGNAELLD